MNKQQEGIASADHTDAEDLAAVYGETEDDSVGLEGVGEPKKDFAPWHHPVKQIVRSKQWAAQAERLITSRQNNADVLRYFTLPGPDLLDVRVLSDVCVPRGIKIEYFGFNASLSKVDGSQNKSLDAARTTAYTTEAVLRQSDRITSSAEIMPDRLEDIAIKDSQAAAQLSQRQPFDIINIDACDHLAYSAEGRQKSMFDALNALLKHQLLSQNPWLLFITTRADPDLLGQPGVAFQHAITQNLIIPDGGFDKALAECLECSEAVLASMLAATWSKRDKSFLKLFCVGLGKHLLQFFHGQALTANVELASAYAYRVYGDCPDMLSLVFRITPEEIRLFPPSTGGYAHIPSLEPKRAQRVAKQAAKLQDLDEAISGDETLKTEAIDGTIALLQASQYHIPSWKEWLANHKVRPLAI